MSTSILGWLLPGVNGYSLSLKVLKMYRVTALPAGRIAQHHYLDVMKSICANDTTLPCHEACCLDLSGKPIPIRENPSTRFPWDQGREPVFFFLTAYAQMQAASLWVSLRLHVSRYLPSGGDIKAKGVSASSNHEPTNSRRL